MRKRREEKPPAGDGDGASIGGSSSAPPRRALPTWDEVLATLAPLLERGVPVIPMHGVREGGECACPERFRCSSIGKRPWARREDESPTVDPEVIRGWFERYPVTNWALIAGSKLNAGGCLVILDIDLRNQGDQTLERLLGEHGPLPATWTVKTGGGGHHYYFFSREPLATRKGMSKGIDFLATGALAVVPPSGHRSGGYYRCEVSPGHAGIAEIPAWLLALVLQQGGPRPATSGLFGQGRGDARGVPAAFDAIPEGERNTSLTSICGKLRRLRLTDPEIEAALQVANLARCDPPLPAVDVSNIVKSLARYRDADDASPPLQLVPLLDLLDEAEKPVDWLVPHFGIAAGRVTLLVGAAGNGKTWLAQELAVVVASGGGTWGGLEVRGGGSVSYLDYEQGGETARRFRRLLSSRNAPRTIPIEVATFPALALDSDCAQARFRDAMTGRRLLVIDSLRAAAPKMKENDSESRAALDMLSKLSETTGCVVVLIAHEGNRVLGLGSSGRPRGSSAFMDAAGCVIAVTAKAGRMTLRHTKAAVTKPATDHEVEVHDVGACDADGKSEGVALHASTGGPAVGASDAEERTAESILAFVIENPGLPKSAVKAAACGDHKTRSRVLDRLISSEKLRTEPGKHNAVCVFPAEHRKEPCPSPGGAGQMI